MKTELLIGCGSSWDKRLKANPDDLQTHFALFELACEQRDIAKASHAADEISRLCGPESANSRATAASRSPRASASRPRW